MTTIAVEETISQCLSQFECRQREVLSRHTSFQIGGAIDFWVEPRSEEELTQLLKISEDFNQSLYLIGGGNNILAEDEEIRGIAVHLGNPSFRQIELLTCDQIRAGAGTDLSQLISWCADKGLSGLEFLAGIPGTIGGGIWMNAGRGWNIRIPEKSPRAREPVKNAESSIPSTAWGSRSHMGEVVESVRLMDENGKIRTLTKNEIEFSYRQTNLPKGIILSAVLQLRAGDSERIREQIRENLKTKIKTQDLYFPSAGCIFKNPANPKKSSGQLIDEVGLRGVRVGQAQFSERHANFIINRANASAGDVLTLIRLAQHKVKEEYGIQLELELKIFRSNRRSHGGVVQ